MIAWFGWVTFQHGRLAPEPFRCQVKPDHFLMYHVLILELKWLVLKDLACETVSGWRGVIVWNYKGWSVTWNFLGPFWWFVVFLPVICWSSIINLSWYGLLTVHCALLLLTLYPLKCHFPTSHTYMPDFMFLYGGIVGQDLGNISIQDKDLLLAVEVSR